MWCCGLVSLRKRCQKVFHARRGQRKRQPLHDKHQPNGQGLPPVFPSLVGTTVVTGPRDEHIKLVIDGVNGSAMQAFGKQLDAAQLGAVVHYERHAWGNNAGDITQPRDVLELSGQ